MLAGMTAGIFLFSLAACSAPPRIPQAAAAPKPIIKTDIKALDSKELVKSARRPPSSPALTPTRKENRDEFGGKYIPRPKQMVGLERGQVTAFLGQPDFIRKDAPAEVWQYRGGVCILDLFLYEEKNGDTYKVAHFEVRGRAEVSVAREECFQSLLKDRRRKTAG
ncbi:MAG: hypothetical protein QF511_02120 [Rhodospirillales bacterium]|jgi:hypothetical protein|nr:hypothetical protein [Rhodospirillales bacterium]HIJ43199.1 hypothetical protein [Rhodospirillaceae bacterium]MDP7097309.1 hypothetical protein [Rhodospirillales bacterium]MDP7214348.1 hypothetical protein [Rhodospirillales bacterium]HIJ45461.1 hypothetical protein [Rhodospirillaceae bacterium]